MKWATEEKFKGQSHDGKFVRLLLLICFGAKKIINTDFHPNVKEFIKGNNSIFLPSANCDAYDTHIFLFHFTDLFGIRTKEDPNRFAAFEQHIDEYVIHLKQKESK